MTNLPSHLWPLFRSVIVGSILAGNAQAQFTFTESTFAPAGWVSYSEATGTGSSVAAQIGSGGNPGTYLRVSQTVQGDATVLNFVFFNSAAYDPSTSGAIATLAGSFDNIDFDNGQGAAIAVRQNGINYGYVPSDTSYPSSWITLSWSSLPAASFQPLGQPTAHPDFSASGGPILFGIITGNGGGFRTTETGYDNFSVTVTSIPEPATMVGWLGLAALGWALRRRAAMCRELG